MTTTNNTIAKFAAVVAMLGLVASSAFAFAPAARAQSTSSDLQAQINALLAQIAALQGNTGTTAAVSFSMDLTLGASGAQVTALQNWLISKGYTIAAGATGYFGAQTQAALAKYQAAEGISPAAGYFGPITRAKVNAAAGGTSTGGTGTGTGTGSTGGLSGDEANLTDFDLVREQSSGSEGEEEVAIATAEFEVEDGDVRVERLELTASSTGTGSASDRPWDYFDSITLTDADGDELASMDVDSRADWDEEDDDSYVLSFTGLDYVVEEGDMAEITIWADISDNLDTTDINTGSFRFYVERDAVRATDAEGIQQYTGSDSDFVAFSFDEEENGDISVRESDENPDAANLKVETDETSDEYTVFAFDIRNTEDVDSLLTDLTIHATTSAANATSTLDSIIRKATLVVDGDEYDADINNSGVGAGDGTLSFEDIDVELAGDETTSFELRVEFASQQNNYASGLTVLFGLDAGVANALEVEGLDSGDEVDAADLGGFAESELHTLSLTGFMVEAVSTSQSVTTPGQNASASYGTYTIKFDVTADEDDQVFVEDTASTTGSFGAIFNILGGYTGTTTASLTSTADMQGGVYRVDAGDTETFTLTVTLDPTASGQFRVELERVNYGTTVGAPFAQGLDVDNDDAGFETDNLFIPN